MAIKTNRQARNRRLRSVILSLSALSFLPLVTVMRAGAGTDSAGLAAVLPAEAVASSVTLVADTSTTQSVAPVTATTIVSAPAAQSASKTATTSASSQTQTSTTTTHTRTSAS